MSTKVLLVEDDDGDAYLVGRHLENSIPDSEITRATRVSEALEAGNKTFDIILLDLTLPDSSGLKTLTTVRAAFPSTPIVLLTGVSDQGMAISCLRNGAQDYLVKEGANEESLPRTIRHSIERMQNERALQRSKAEFQALVEHAPYGIFRSNSEGDFLDVNEALIRMLGCETKNQALALNLSKDVCLDIETFGGKTELGLVADHLPEVEVPWRRRDGRQITVRLTGRVVRRDDGSPDGFEVFAEDVSDRIVLEAQLRQTQKMEAVGQLAGGIAHEINNLLSIILADTELIQHALPSGMEELARDVDEVKQVAIRGGSLVKRLLGFSRKQRLAVEVVALSDLVGEMVDMLRRLVHESVLIEFEAEGGQAQIRIDPGTVEQILLNLTTNARDAMPEGGELTITAGSTVLDDGFCLEHPGARPGPVGYLRLTDTGTGMDEETRERVFEPFYSTKVEGEGTGLGMSMVYGLVKQQDGFISIDSEPGRGTTIEIFFPQVKEESAPKPKGPAAATGSKGTETILLVEDEDELRRAAQRALERFGFSVILAADGAEGIERYRKNRDRIDLVLSDVVMPNLGGPAFIEKLLAEANRAAPAIIFMSGYPSGEWGSNPLLDGRYPLLEKPWEVRTLLDSVRRMLDDHKPSEASRGGGHALVTNPN